MKRFKKYITELDAGKATGQPKGQTAKPPTHVDITKEKQKRSKEDLARQQTLELDRARGDDFQDKTKELKNKEAEKNREKEHDDANRKASEISRKREKESAQANTKGE